MASIVTGLISGGALDGISKVINSIRGKSPEDAAKLAELASKYQSELLAADAQAQQSQADINKIEAGSSDKYTSRWRPTIGYVCAAAFASNFVVGPFVTFLANTWGHPVQWFEFDTTTIMPVLLGLLGLGGMRSWEKVNKAA